MNIVALAFRSIVRFAGLVFGNALHLRKERLGERYKIEKYGTYKIFRETESTKPNDQSPVTLLVGFRLKILGNNPFLHWLFQRICICTTPFWSGFTGFHIKLWMVDPKTYTYAGIYQWYGESNANIYVHALITVLKPLSTPHSVWYELLNEDIKKYLFRTHMS